MLVILHEGVNLLVFDPLHAQIDQGVLVDVLLIGELFLVEDGVGHLNRNL